MRACQDASAKMAKIHAFCTVAKMFGIHVFLTVDALDHVSVDEPRKSDHEEHSRCRNVGHNDAGASMVLTAVINYDDDDDHDNYSDDQEAEHMLVVVMVMIIVRIRTVAIMMTSVVNVRSHFGSSVIVQASFCPAPS